MCSNDKVDEHISRQVSSPPPTLIPTSALSTRNQKTFDQKAFGSVPLTRNTNLAQQLLHHPYQHYQQQINHHSTGRGAGIPQHSIANMSSILGNNSVVPAGILPPLDHYRLQLYNYAMAERLRCSQYSSGSGISGQLPMCAPGYPSAAAAAAAAVSGGNSPYAPSRFALSMSFFHNRVFQPEEPKPQHSYIGLIAMAILNSPESKLVLSDIYQHILDNYPYFRTRGPGWRNSIRHNLSLNDCFIKAGRSANGKGHYWAIHPANLEDFKKGDFRRRKAQRKVRKHMGLAVDDDGTDSSSPPPLAATPPPTPHSQQGLVLASSAQSTFCAQSWAAAAAAHAQAQAAVVPAARQQNISPALYSHSTRKRQFDVASLLAPDEDELVIQQSPRSPSLSVSDSPQHDRHCFRDGQQDRRPNQLHIFSKLPSAKRVSLGEIDFEESENEEDIDVEASDAENNNNNHSIIENALDEDNPGLILGYHDEDGMLGDNLLKEEARIDTTPPGSLLNQHQQQFEMDHPQRSPTQTSLATDEDNVPVESSNDSQSTARAAVAVAAASWHGIIQHWPGNFQQHLNNISPSNVNSRILQRYYGQYMAAAAAQQAAVVAAATKNRRHNSALGSFPDFNNAGGESPKYQQPLPQHRSASPIIANPNSDQPKDC